MEKLGVQLRGHVSEVFFLCVEDWIRFYNLYTPMKTTSLLEILIKNFKQMYNFEILSNIS